MKKCLCCMESLSTNQSNYHVECLRSFWGNDTPQEHLDFSVERIEDLAISHIQNRLSLTGVQPKISMGFGKKNQPKRFTLIGALEGDYILKPPFSQFPQLPEIEFLSMHLTKSAGIPTVPFLLIPFSDGKLAYLTKRVDRGPNGIKYAMEDACQFSGKLTDQKYLGSYEQIAKKIQEYCENGLFETLRFYEQVLIGYLIGNSDAHFKNFSIINTNHAYKLSPAYDMVATTLLIPEDLDELALHLNGKKRKIKRIDVSAALTNSGIPEKAQKKLWQRITRSVSHWGDMIDNSLLSETLKKSLLDTIRIRANNLSITIRW